MSFKSPLGKAMGTGSAKTGTGHWLHQRITAVALIPLVLWFVFSMANVIGADYAEAVIWIQHPLNATLFLALIIAMFYHASLGLQVVIEDYVHHEGVKTVSLIFIKLAFILAAIASVLSILKVALIGGMLL